MARERALVDDADEVRYAEIAFHPRHPAGLDEVRAAVDALPDEARPAPLPEPAPVPAVEPPPSALPDETRAALEAALPGRLVAARTAYLTTEGEVVEASWETAEGARGRGLFVVREDAARPFDDVAARVDALPLPAEAAGPVAAPASESPPREVPVHAPAEALPGEAPPAPGAAPEPTPAAEEAPKKGGFASRFRRGKDKDAPAPEEAPPAEDAAPPAEKKRFGFRRK